MEIQPVVPILPVVIGTAGHIDHGKSSLVKALTGIDPDRLKEEQERGMTIDLGFARFALADGRTVGMVDVPGHERFIKNMVAGATGIDLVLLVVAADDGVMPQTREHLAILELLGLQRGLIALSKIDLVSPELVLLAEEDVRSAVRGTFLAEAPIVRVSAATGEGLPELREKISALATAAVPRSDESVFRMPIQRVFSARGFGTVVTGIPLSGSVAIGDALEIAPGGMRGRVRGLQAYHAPASRVRAGHSSAINLSDVDHKLVRRGCVAATPGFFRAERMVAARLSVLGGLAHPVEDRTRVRLHVGTAEVVGEVVLLDAEELAPGASGLVQLRLDEPVVTAPGDRFVLRLASPASTLGGGVILEESRHRLKRFKGFVVEELARQEEHLHSPAGLAEVALERAGLERPTTEELAFRVKRPVEETRALLEGAAREGRAIEVGHGRWVHESRMAEASARLAQALESWFAEHSHREVAEVLELRRRTGFDADLCSALLARAEREGRVVIEAGGRIRAARRAAPDSEADERRQRVLACLSEAGLQPPPPEEIGTRLGLAPAVVRQCLEACADRGEARAIAKDIVVARVHLERAAEAIAENCRAHGELDIPSLRDRLATTRKFLIPLLEYFDAQGLTARQGGRRVLKRSRGSA